jgi:hypothetical protein
VKTTTINDLPYCDTCASLIVHSLTSCFTHHSALASLSHSKTHNNACAVASSPRRVRVRDRGGGVVDCRDLEIEDDEEEDEEEDEEDEEGIRS